MVIYMWFALFGNACGNITKKLFNPCADFLHIKTARHGNDDIFACIVLIFKYMQLCTCKMLNDMMFA